MSVDEALQSSKIYDHSFLQILEIIGNFVDFLTLFGPAYFDVSAKPTPLEAGLHLV